MQSSTPFFSIILPCYNRATLLEGAISSVLTQTFTSFELIIVDDGSTDNTQQVVGRFSDLRIRYFYKKNEERSIARNFGISKAVGDYVNFLDSDDLFYAHHLETAYQQLKGKRSVEIVHTSFEIRNDNNELVRRSAFNSSSVRHLTKENSFQCNAIFIRRDIAMNHQFLPDRKAIIAEDWYLWLVLASRFNITFSDTVTCVVREHSTRSLNKLSPSRVSESFEVIFKALEHDDQFLQFYGSRAYSRFKARNLCFVALITILHHNKVQARRELVRAFNVNPRIAFSRPFLAVLKKIVLS